MQYQEHFGKRFYLDQVTGYWISTCCPKIRAHRWVWMCNHGEIEDGFHIHHIDGNKSNNNIENLQKVKESEHYKMHLTEERRDWARKWAEVIRPLTKSWHRSEEGRAWHKKHGILGWSNRKPFEKCCVHCSTKYETKTYHQDFCSNKCKSADRRKRGVDNEKRACENCSKLFEVNKYARKRFCSRSCSSRRKNKIN